MVGTKAPLVSHAPSEEGCTRRNPALLNPVLSNPALFDKATADKQSSTDVVLGSVDGAFVMRRPLDKGEWAAWDPGASCCCRRYNVNAPASLPSRLTTPQKPWPTKVRSVILEPAPCILPCLRSQRKEAAHNECSRRNTAFDPQWNLAFGRLGSRPALEMLCDGLCDGHLSCQQVGKGHRGSTTITAQPRPVSYAPEP